MNKNIITVDLKDNVIYRNVHGLNRTNENGDFDYEGEYFTLYSYGDGSDNFIAHVKASDIIDISITVE